MTLTSARTHTNTASDGFAGLDVALKLDPAVDARAKELRAVIDEVLTEAGWLQLSLLQGSYGRKTMYPPLKDVDLVVVLPRSMEKRLRDNPLGSAIAMEALKTALVNSGRLSGVQFDATDAPAHALQLSFPDVSFTFDLVPAFETDDPDWLVIADRAKRRWDKRSDVRALRNKAMARNVKSVGRWVRQVRHAKHSLRQDPPVKQLVCGLLVESLAYDAVTTAISPQKAALAIFRRGAQALSGPYKGLAQEDLTAKWTAGERAQVVDYFVRNHDLAQEAVQCEAAGDQVAASSIWRKIYGEAFPEAAVPFQDRLASVVRTGGGLTSTGRLTTSPSVAGATNPARAWRSR